MPHKFDENRKNFYPYGITCELWSKSKMLKPDRHNEIEVNFIPNGSITYLIRNKMVTIPENKIAVFWALTPHQIIETSDEPPYYVCTIPFNIFLNWQLPKDFVETLFKGSVIVEGDFSYENNHALLFESWRRDMESGSEKLKNIALLELNARMQRLAHHHYQVIGGDTSPEVQLDKIQVVERIAAFISNNYLKDVKGKDVAEVVNLHPDYANKIFKKAFGITIKEYITSQRISHAKRLLSTTEKKISTIAFESGYNSLSRFNAAFQQDGGLTPNQYRKQQKHGFF